MYQSFLNSPSGKNWRRIGLKRRAGVAAPLFSIYSKNSVGIGELPDLKLLMDWCKESGLSLIQLLPMNDVGCNFKPYDAESGFALEPMYLSLDFLKEVDSKNFQQEINTLRQRFQFTNKRRAGLNLPYQEIPPRPKRVNYGVKSEKINLLWQIFKSSSQKSSSFKKFISSNQYWLEDYALFKVLSERHEQKNWEAWPGPFKERHSEALQQFQAGHLERIHFYRWLQWQLFHQFKEVRSQAKKKNILIMGDLPFLAARNSADVWAHQNYFKLDLSSGAPPDAYFANGQRWGTPPCHWETISANGFDYIQERLKYAQHFYDLLRIDHVVGLFRLWSIPITEPTENGGLNGFFDPPDEAVWEEHGRKLLSVFLNSKMLACAEDLGTVPECSYRVLAEFAIPGIDVQRWTRDLNQPSTFKSADEYRKNSMAVISTHDMTSFQAWWDYEAGTVYEPLFKRQCEAKGIDFEWAKPLLFDVSHVQHERLRWREDVRNVQILAERLGRAESEISDLVNDYHLSYREKEKFCECIGTGSVAGQVYQMDMKPVPARTGTSLLKAALNKISASASIFSVQLLQDWLALGHLFKEDSWETRVNFPGTISNTNWSIVMPVSLEEMQNLPINKEIKKINRTARRC